ncbi:hypothetical protein SETIT_6G009800v2 [Setaria italica]|nr:hypothetical protein SETIT_6G009800v2 [Setaria italica]
MTAVQVSSLTEAFDQVVARRSLIVQSLRPCDAAALLKMVELQAGFQEEEGEEVCVIKNKEAVMKVEESVNILSLLMSTVLPKLREYPTDRPLLEALCRYKEDMKKSAADAGGSYCTDINVFASRVTEYIDKALELPDPAALVRLIDDLEGQGRRILDTTYTINHN